MGSWLFDWLTDWVLHDNQTARYKTNTDKWNINALYKLKLMDLDLYPCLYIRLDVQGYFWGVELAKLPTIF